MGWSIGYDGSWERDIGYGVPAHCDHKGCNEEIHRGLSYVCCGEPYGGDHGCGRFFCEKHMNPEWNDDGDGEEWRVCGHGDDDYISPDHPEWIQHKLTDPSWQAWREENEDWVTAQTGRTK